MTQTAEAGGAVLQKVANAMQVGGVVGSVGSATKHYWGYSLDEWTVIGIVASITLGVLGFVVGTAVNIYYKQKHYRLARDKAARDFYDEH